MNIYIKFDSFTSNCVVIYKGETKKKLPSYEYRLSDQLYTLNNDKNIIRIKMLHPFKKRFAERMQH